MCTVVGLSGNFIRVALGYVYLCGTESRDTWRRAWTFFSHGFPSMGRITTVASNGYKGVSAGLEEVFEERDRPCQVACSKDRADNLRRYGRDCTAMFHTLINANTVEGIAEGKVTAQYTTISENSQNALNSVLDEKHYLAAAVAHGSRVYGKSASMAVESNNFAKMDARCLDLFNSVLWLGERQKRVRDEQAIAAHSAAGVLTPRLPARFAALQPEGEVTDLPLEITPTFLFYNDLCSRDFFRYGHMVAVAFHAGISERLLVPFELSNAFWRMQYPLNATVAVPNLADVRASDVPDDASLCVPVTAPPKRGRPNTRRNRGAMEKVSRRVRQNTGS